MSMPDPTRRQTRAKNKDTHPMKDLGALPAPRRTSEQVQADKAAKEAQERVRAKNQQEKIAALARLEDEDAEDSLHMEEIVETPTAGRRPAKKMVARDTAPAGRAITTAENGGNSDDESGDGDGDSDTFRPDKAEEEEMEDDDESDDADARGKPKKAKRIANREDVAGLRRTADIPGDRAHKRKASQEKTKSGSKKKAKAGKKAGLDKKVLDAGKGSGVIGAEDEEMLSKPGGYALEDDADEVVEKPSTQKRGLPKSNQLSITSSTRLTATAIRGGDKKWTYNHLPPGTADRFKNEVIPLARERVACKPPWTMPTVQEVQDLVDTVYGKGAWAVAEKSAWYGLTCYRISDWRTGFPTLAKAAVNMLMTQEDNDEEQEMGGVDADDGDKVPAASGGGAAGAIDEGDADADLPAAEPAFTFRTKEGRAEFVEWALQVHKDEHGKETGTHAFQWRVWNGGRRKSGFMMSFPIVYTFSHHVTTLRDVPEKYPTRDVDKSPSGALIYASQAVQRELEFWKSGDYAPPEDKKLVPFSSENWGDYSEMSKGGRGKDIRRATKYLEPLKRWSESKWQDLYMAAEVHANDRARHGKRKASRSAASSDVESRGDVDVEQDAIILSD
ncbi:hypothetical protein MKEN_01170300 [Mycena kentingensis (nom. inval.)]|nr:hypothetical protein MKEN_01170300 [Mycena kentingensis (nom. inval.)]